MILFHLVISIYLTVTSNYDIFVRYFHAKKYYTKLTLINIIIIQKKCRNMLKQH